MKNNKTRQKQKPIQITTAKDQTKAIETRAGILKDAEPKAVEELKTKVYLQYMGKETSTEEIADKVKLIWTKELGKEVQDMKSLNIYLKPEESAAYYVINEEITGKVEL
ncbi:MAG: DUF6465 family protein [Dorea sp.]|nr:DUF6465 family protein [Dorea sp.]